MNDRHKQKKILNRMSTNGGLLTKQELVAMIMASKTRIAEVLPDYPEGSHDYIRGKRGIEQFTITGDSPLPSASCVERIQ